MKKKTTGARLRARTQRGKLFNKPPQHTADLNRKKRGVDIGKVGGGGGTTSFGPVRLGALGCEGGGKRGAGKENARRHKTQKEGGYMRSWKKSEKGGKGGRGKGSTGDV